jgi:hypothetical protein
MNVQPNQTTIAAIYPTHEAASRAVEALQRAGFDMKTVSIIGKGSETEENAFGFYTTGERILTWGGRGAFWGSLWGVLFGSAFLFVPVVGPLVVMGPLVLAMAAGLEGAALGGTAGILAAALTSSGLPEESVATYETAIREGSYVVVTRGGSEAVSQARSILGVTVEAMPRAERSSRADLLTRAAVLGLLTEDEISRVAMAETADHLPDGDEYLDLGRLDRGVQRSRGVHEPMGRVLPRSAVPALTWDRILTRLEPLPPSLL